MFPKQLGYYNFVPCLLKNCRRILGSLNWGNTVFCSFCVLSENGFKVSWFKPKIYWVFCMNMKLGLSNKGGLLILLQSLVLMRLFWERNEQQCEYNYMKFFRTMTLHLFLLVCFRPGRVMNRMKNVKKSASSLWMLDGREGFGDWHSS